MAVAPTSNELDQFLSDLSARRARVLGLIGAGNDDLSAEVQALSEQLLVADEELRIQQEELAATRDHVRTLAHERDRLFQTSSEPYLLTDEHGMVVGSNRAADALLLRSHPSLARRPVAGLFHAQDRRRIRELVGRVRSNGDHEVVDGLHLLRPDGRPLAVSVAVYLATRGAGHTSPRLRWLLRPEPGALAALPKTSPSAAGTHAATIAAALAPHRELDALLPAAARLAVTVLDAADEAAVVLPATRSLERHVAWSGDGAGLALELERRLGDGPAVCASLQQATVVVADWSAETRWPRLAARLREVGFGSTAAVPLTVPGQQLGALAVHARAAKAFDEADAFALEIAATHVAAAVSRSIMEHDLRQALTTRQLIGEAVGIMVERRRITSEAAFQLLASASQNHNVKLRELAKVVVETGQDPAEIFVR